ncbi:transmembrane protein 14C-like [Geospiza fortis]|uniref:Transmembrane protein 14C n=1 Tax=Geospiza fortis TaxID=48883 RepID=A0A6I9ZA23_GEOFO|nr:transmembrane protein 14C-like [Geospiza fortis]
MEDPTLEWMDVPQRKPKLQRGAHPGAIVLAELVTMQKIHSLEQPVPEGLHPMEGPTLWQVGVFCVISDLEKLENCVTGSVPSLAAGLLFGGLAGLGAYQQSKDPKSVWLSLVASGTLSTVMGMRFYNSKKAMPGIIAGASLLMVGRLGLQMMEKPIKP